MEDKLYELFEDKNTITHITMFKKESIQNSYLENLILSFGDGSELTFSISEELADCIIIILRIARKPGNVVGELNDLILKTIKVYEAGWDDYEYEKKEEHHDEGFNSGYEEGYNDGYLKGCETCE